MAIGWGLPALKHVAGATLGREGLAVAFVVNLAMPLLIVTLSAACPKLWVAVPGTFLATLALLISGSHFSPRPDQHGLTAVVQQLHPILVVACVAYHVLAVVTVLMVRKLAPSMKRCMSSEPTEDLG
jgi:hypothetical protein